MPRGWLCGDEVVVIFMIFMVKLTLIFIEVAIVMVVLAVKPADTVGM